MKTDTAPPPAGASGRGDDHAFSLRVYYEDTDAAGIVYYANYLRFAERARTEWLRLLDGDGWRHVEEAGLAFAVAHCAIAYLRPARLHDVLTVTSRLGKVGFASLTMTQVVWRGAVRLAHMEVRLACVGAALRPLAIPKALRLVMVAHTQRRKVV